jgi:hypothetical protein
MFVRLRLLTIDVYWKGRKAFHGNQILPRDDAMEGITGSGVATYVAVLASEMSS